MIYNKISFKIHQIALIVCFSVFLLSVFYTKVYAKSMQDLKKERNISNTIQVIFGENKKHAEQCVVFFRLIEKNIQPLKDLIKNKYFDSTNLCVSNQTEDPKQNDLFISFNCKNKHQLAKNTTNNIKGPDFYSIRYGTLSILLNDDITVSFIITTSKDNNKIKPLEQTNLSVVAYEISNNLDCLIKNKDKKMVLKSMEFIDTSKLKNKKNEFNY